jgi:hypothetical protein
MSESESVNRIMIGALILGGLAVGGYYVYRVYQKEKLSEMASGKKPRFVEVPIGGPPPMKKNT